MNRGATILLTLSVGLGASLARAAQTLPALLTPSARLVSAQPWLGQRRLDLSHERNQLRREFALQAQACSAVPQSHQAQIQTCLAERQSLTVALVAHIAASTAYNQTVEEDEADPNALAGRPAGSDLSYRPVGDGLIGGTTWITGYESASDDPQLMAKERQMMRLQMKLAGLPYDESVDFRKYSFVLGIARSTDALTDLGERVVFDELHNGNYSADSQQLYDSLKGRAFDELGCHSNGAMICLAALQRRDAVADHVVLYGPQITLESLGMWDALIRSGRVKSVQIVVNAGDPVPPVSLLAGGGAAAAMAESAIATFRTPDFSQLVLSAAPTLQVKIQPCGNGSLTLACHALSAYRRGSPR